jgi:hypothetical protein
MTELTPAQESHAKELRDRWRRRLEIRESNDEDGGVERELSSFFSGLAMTYHKLGITEYYCSDLATAQSDFQSAASYYLGRVAHYFRGII